MGAAGEGGETWRPSCAVAHHDGLELARAHPSFLHPAGEMKDTVSVAGLIDQYSSSHILLMLQATKARGASYHPIDTPR